MRLSNLQTFKLSNLLFAAALLAFAPQSAFAADVTVQVEAGQEAFGKVSGGKANAKEGATLTLKATPAKGYGFAGWFKDSSTRVSWQSSWKYTVGSANETFTARFVAMQDDDITFSDKQPDGYKFGLDHVPVRDEFMILAAMSEVKLTVSGLPSGIKAKYGTVPKTNGSVEFSGTAKKPGVYFVTITAKNANGFTRSLVQKWVVGTSDDTPPGDFDDIGLNANKFKSWTAGAEHHVYLPDVLDEPEEGMEIPDEELVHHTVVKYAVSGLPPGIEYIYRNDSWGHYLYGYPTKPGKYTISFTVTLADKTSRKAKKTVVVTDEGTYYVSVSVPPDYAGRGTVKGSGIYKVGANISLVATPAKDYCFAGWFTDAACTVKLTDHTAASGDTWHRYTAGSDWRNPKETMTLYKKAANDALNIYAKFVQKGDDYIKLFLDDSWDIKSEYELDPNKNAYGSYLRYVVDSVSYPTVTAKNLPPGMKLDPVERELTIDHEKFKPGMRYENVQLTVKTQTGLTKTVTFALTTKHFRGGLLNCFNDIKESYFVMTGEKMEKSSVCDDLHMHAANLDWYKSLGWSVTATGLPPGVKAEMGDGCIVLTGIPTKAGKYNPVLRMVGEKESTQWISFTLEVAPFDEIDGTYNGVTCFDDYVEDGKEPDVRPESRQVTVTVAKGAGKVTAKVGKISFSGTGWERVDDYNWKIQLRSGKVKEDGRNCVYVMYINLNTYWDHYVFSQMDITGYMMREIDMGGGNEVEDGMDGMDKSFFAYRDYYGSKDDKWAQWDTCAETLAKQKLAFSEGNKNWSGEKLGIEHSLSYYDGTGSKPTVKMSVSKKGVCKVSGKIGGISVSGSAMMIPTYVGYWHMKCWIPVVSGGRRMLVVPAFSLLEDGSIGNGCKAYEREVE